MRISETNKSGFTLVELSIVLVVIGLLIGGILVGQSLIESAKLNSFISQMQQYDIAVQNFKLKYKGLPGDIRLNGATGGLPKNSYIEDDDGINNDLAGDIALYWRELKTGTDFKSKCTSYSSVFTSGVILKGTGCNLPNAEIGNNAAIIVGTNSNNSYVAGTPAATRYKTLYYMMDCSLMTTNRYNCTSAFTAQEAAAYDNKTDDGISNTGNVLGLKNRTFSQAGNPVIAPYTSSITGPNYDTSIATPNYILVQYLGIN